jgi:hypothetical protein
MRAFRAEGWDLKPACRARTLRWSYAPAADRGYASAECEPVPEATTTALFVFFVRFRGCLTSRQTVLVGCGRSGLGFVGDSVVRRSTLLACKTMLFSLISNASKYFAKFWG